MKTIKKIISLDPFAGTITEHDLVSMQRFRLFKTVTFISLVVFLVFLIQVWVVLPGNNFILLIMAGLFVIAFINYFVLAYHKNTRLAFTILLLIWFILIHVDTYYSGGIRNSANFYLAALILNSYMLLGTRGGVLAAVLSFLHLVYFYLVSIYTDWVSYALIGDSSRLIFLYYFLSTSAAIIILTFQSAYIERSKNKVISLVRSGKNELAVKNQELTVSEANLAQKIHELEAKNKELEQFAYVASHDLQEPIRTTAGFIELLQRQYKGKLDERGDQYLAYIAESSERMKTLIKELLDYSRIGFQEQKNLIDCNLLLKELLTDLASSITGAGAVVHVRSLPSINGYAIAIKQLFQNLLLNAIKFRRPNIIPEVEIKGWRDNNSWHFSVADNGIGIHPEFFDKIFIIFQRLHTRTEYDGSGIGLSHCKKIIELHNGKIWVESVPDQGSTFHFTIA